MRKEPMKIGDLLKKYNLLVLLIVFIVIASILSPNFLTVGNVLNLLQQASIPGIVAIGMTLVIIISGIDLSVGSVAALAGMISAILVSKNVPIIIAVLAGVVLGAALGLVTGIYEQEYIDIVNVKNEIEEKNLRDDHWFPEQTSDQFES